VDDPLIDARASVGGGASGDVVVVLDSGIVVEG
jgi:hypothetical protein